LVLVMLGWLGWRWIDLSRALEKAERVRAETEAVKTLAQVLGGGVLLYGIYLTLRRIRALERQVEVAQEEQVTERFTRAIEQLGSEKMEIRLGGIYALERIAKDSDKDYWTIMEVLTAFIRENAPWQPRPSQADPGPQPEKETAAGAGPGKAGGGEETPASPAPPKPKPPTDIQAALTVLGRRQRRPDEPPLDLRKTDLRGADLRRAHLEGAYLIEAHLERAKLEGAHLEGADLYEVHLKGANLSGANLEEANLSGANLKMAKLIKAHLEGAELFGANLEWACLRGANMERAILSMANLERAKLYEAHLEGAFLNSAKLKGADLLKATGLTWEQVEAAIIDDQTKLPDYLLKERGKGSKKSTTPAGEGPERPPNPAGDGAG
jgi:uncharacterized protein YjbI with pentapeptide repeats